MRINRKLINVNLTKLRDLREISNLNSLAILLMNSNGLKALHVILSMRKCGEREGMKIKPKSCIQSTERSSTSFIG